MAEEFAVKLSQAKAPFVLALDVGSTAARGGLFDAKGRPILGTRIKVDHDFATSSSGRSAISPDLVVDEVTAIIDAIVTKRLAGKIAAVAMDTFSSAVVGVDDGGAAITPCFTYADSRPASDVSYLLRRTDEVALQHRTGTRLHSSYLPARLHWLRRVEPDTFDLAETWMSLGEYVYLRLLGVRGASMSSAAWTGLLNRHTGQWDPEAVELAGITMDRLSPVLPGAETFTTSPRMAQRWPGLADSVWLPAIPDGYASTLGPVTDERTITLGSSTSGAMRLLVNGIPGEIPPGLWAYRVHEDRTLVGGALNDVGRMVTWLDSTINVPNKAIRESWMRGRPNPASPIVLPFLTGERSTGWRSDARAIIGDIGESTDAAALYRGGIEGIAMTYRRVAEQMAEVSGDINGIVATGGITQSFPGWLHVLANVLGMPVTPKAMKRSTLRGAALLALDHVAPGIERTIHETADPVVPNRAWVSEYNARYERFCELYETLYGV
ncbi:MAG: gluconokinase [Ruaniaceae bacterium]|nr:gluconokinase [Ruaniaceae bacterium]